MWTRSCALSRRAFAWLPSTLPTATTNPIPGRRGARALSYDSYNIPVAGLGGELEELRGAVHDFAQRELAPRAQAIDATNDFPADMWRKFGDMGLLGITAPVK
jgi:hypothetical protein